MTKIINTRLAWISTATIASLLLVCYILQINQLALYQYQTRDYEKRLMSLTKKKDVLDINLSKANSLSHVEQYLVNKDFVKSNQVRYVQVLGSSVASNK